MLSKFAKVRLRTISVTLSLTIVFIFAIFVKFGLNSVIDWITLILTTSAGIVFHCVYYPDGELNGTKDTTYIANHDSYNDKATKINKDGKFMELRQFCNIEYELRKKNYIELICSKIGITTEELETYRYMSRKEIDSLEYIKLDDGVRCIYFDKRKKKLLKSLLFKDLPIEKNQAETIMSATDVDGYKAIKDGSVKFKKRAYISKIMTSMGFGLVFAYISYTLRNGVGMAQITQISLYLVTLFTTAVTSFTTGEISTKVYKNRFYLRLANFIDEFDSYQKNPEKYEIKQ